MEEGNRLMLRRNSFSTRCWISRAGSRTVFLNVRGGLKYHGWRCWRFGSRDGDATDDDYCITMGMRGRGNGDGGQEVIDARRPEGVGGRASSIQAPHGFPEITFSKYDAEVREYLVQSNPCA
jgi:hypothetical protein